MFENILVPLDGSEYSARALENAVQIAGKLDGKNHAGSCVFSSWSGSVSAITMAETGISAHELVFKLDEVTREAGARILEDGEERVKAEEVQVKTLLRQGLTVGVILKMPKEGEFDLIVIVAGGLSKIKRKILGKRKPWSDKTCALPGFGGAVA